MNSNNLESYLERIGYDGPRTCSVQTLDRIIRTHLESVPFENLDICDAKKDISLRPQDLFDKIVVRRRGGYCFELNALLHEALLAMGFRGYAIAARIVFRRDEAPPLSHRATIVELDGKRWFCDVGFGGPGPKGLLCLSDTQPQDVAGEQFLAQKQGDNWIICRAEADGWTPVLSLQNVPYEDADFAVLNAFFSKSPTSLFTQSRRVNLCLPDGHIALTDLTLTIKRGEALSVIQLPDQNALLEQLRAQFGIELNQVM